MPRRTLVPLLLCSALLTAGAQQPSGPMVGAAAPPPNTLLRADPRVRVGTLPNGLRYYSRQNAKPVKRAELRLVVNAGSVLEDDTQLGYAHFIEHTAFNGTTHFAKNDLVSYLQTIGVQFGADLDAQTGVDETIYILPVPTDSAAIVAKAFQILEDWAHGQVFDAAQVIGERGVVREEWRGRKGAGERVFRLTLPIELKGSKYAARMPIGTEASIMSASPPGLRSFYSRWYRPDLMAVIAVGDFDPVRIEKQIRSHFAGIPRAPHPTPRPTVDVPGNAAPRVAIATDPELTGTTVEVAYKARATPTRTVADYRRDLIASLYTEVLNARLSEIAQTPGAPCAWDGRIRPDRLGQGRGGRSRGWRRCSPRRDAWVGSDFCRESSIARSRVSCAPTSARTRSGTRQTRRRLSRSLSTISCVAMRCRASRWSITSCGRWCRGPRSRVKR